MSLELLRKVAEKVEEDEKKKKHPIAEYLDDDSPEEEVSKEISSPKKGENKKEKEKDDDDEEKTSSLLMKIAIAMGDEDNSAGADNQRNQVEEEGKKPEKKEKKEKKKGENPFAKKEEGGEKPKEGNGQAGPVPAEEVPAEAPPAGAEAVPAENGAAAPAAPAEGAVPAEGAMPAEGAAPGAVDITQIIDFLQANPNPMDSDVHAFAERNGMAPDQMETMIYGLSQKTVNFLRGGKMSEAQLDINTVDPQQLEIGVQIEQEHTPDLSIAKKIALDHLVEIPDYYTRLQEMEAAAKNEAGAAAIPIKPNMNGEGPEEESEETKENDVNQPVGAQNRAEL